MNSLVEILCVWVKSLYWPLLPALVTGKLFSMRGLGLGVYSMVSESYLAAPLGVEG